MTNYFLVRRGRTRTPGGGAKAADADAPMWEKRFIYSARCGRVAVCRERLPRRLR
jgi:hypothetical protein